MTTNDHKPFEILLDQEMTINTICQNLVAAGVLLPEEVDRYKGVLVKYAPITLVKVLLESHLLREAHEEAQQ